MATKQNKTQQINTANYIRISTDAAQALHSLALVTGRSRKHITSAALLEYIAREVEVLARKGGR